MSKQAGIPPVSALRMPLQTGVVLGLLTAVQVVPCIALEEFREPISLSESAPLSPYAEAALRPGDEFSECEACPRMIVVPAGTFVMGSPPDEAGRSEDEGPQRQVTIASPFAAGKYPVTFDEWDACLKKGRCRGFKPGDRGWGRGRRPVISLRWEDAEAFIAWLGETTGRRYRMLSEAEYEYIARAGTITPFWFGHSISSELANYDGEFRYGSLPTGLFRRKTVPVDSFKPNPWGFYQVLGNSFSWTSDCYYANYNGAPADGTPRQDAPCESMVFRGGAWLLPPWHLRSASRGRVAVNINQLVVGVRVARSLRR